MMIDCCLMESGRKKQAWSWTARAGSRPPRYFDDYPRNEEDSEESRSEKGERAQFDRFDGVRGDQGRDL